MAASLPTFTLISNAFIRKISGRSIPLERVLWAHAGRTDGLIILSHGECLQAAKIEADITNHPDIRAVVVGGEGRLHPDIGKANRLCSEYVKLRKELMVCARATKPLLRTVKNTISRRESLALYRAEIDALYAHSRLDQPTHTLYLGTRT